MPLTASGKAMMYNMKKEYGSKKGEEVYYKMLNKHPGMRKKMEKNYSKESINMARRMV